MNFIGIFLFSFKDNNSLDSNEYGRIRMRMVSMCPIHCSLTWLFVGGLMLSQRRRLHHHHHRHLPKVLHYLLGVFAVNMLMGMCVCALGLLRFRYHLDLDFIYLVLLFSSLWSPVGISIQELT